MVKYFSMSFFIEHGYVMMLVSTVNPDKVHAQNLNAKVLLADWQWALSNTVLEA